MSEDIREIEQYLARRGAMTEFVLRAKQIMSPNLYANVLTSYYQTVRRMTDNSVLNYSAFLKYSALIWRNSMPNWLRGPRELPLKDTFSNEKLNEVQIGISGNTETEQSNPNPVVQTTKNVNPISPDRSSKREAVRSYRRVHPEATKAECAKALGITWATVNKWWNSDL